MTQDSIKHFDYLMVGGGMAAAFAADGIREVDSDGTIGILSTDQDAPYTRPALTKKLWTDEEFTEDNVPLNAEETGAELFLETEVTSIDKENKRVRTADGQTFSYNKLLLATGGEPQRIDGPDDARVLAFRSFEDYRTLRRISGSGTHVIVVGGSYIGTELAANLALNNTQVTFIYPQDKLSDTRFPDELAEEYEQPYRNHGIKMMNNTRASSYTKNGDQFVVSLENGETVTGDAIVLGIGVEPRLELAKEAGLEVEDGVVTDEFFRTSDPDIFAAGDIVSYPDPILGRHRIEHVDHARKSGTTVGKNMAGAQEPYDYTPYFYSQVFDISWKAIGTLDPELDYYIDEVDGGKVVYYLEDNKPVGILTWNVEPDLDEVRNVLSNPPESKESLKGLIREKEDNELLREEKLSMPLFAEGSYDSFEEVVRAVDTLVMRGHSKADMKLAGNSSALETVDKSAGITTVDHSNVSDKEVSSLLNDYRSELDEGQLVLLVDEDKDQGEEQSVDTHPGDAER